MVRRALRFLPVAIHAHPSRVMLAAVTPSFGGVFFGLVRVQRFVEIDGVTGRLPGGDFRLVAVDARGVSHDLGRVRPGRAASAAGRARMVPLKPAAAASATQPRTQHIQPGRTILPTDMTQSLSCSIEYPKTQRSRFMTPGAEKASSPFRLISSDRTGGRCPSAPKGRRCPGRPASIRRDSSPHRRRPPRPCPPRPAGRPCGRD